MATQQVTVDNGIDVAALLGLEKAYWVPVSCLAVMQGVTLRASWQRNVHRIEQYEKRCAQ